MLIQDEEPITLSVKEEVDLGTEVGVIEAKDEDIGNNGMIDYLIICKFIALCYNGQSLQPFAITTFSQILQIIWDQIWHK